jgi:tripartite-type tricarboxylate transporter receptor subunit TctC
MRFFRFLLVVAAVSGADVHAQYPTRPVRILVPLAPGGGMDTVARGLAQKFSESFSQSVVIDNRPGAGSQIALDTLAAAAPDGHTLMMISSTTVIHPLLYKSRYDILREFQPVSQSTAQGYVLVSHPSVPAKSVTELVQYLRRYPAKLTFASSGIGSPIHMSGELFQIATGTRLIHVPFKGMGAAYTDLVAGRIDLAFPTTISAIPYITTARLRTFAVTTPKRVSALPDVPTFAQAGVKGVVVVNWYGLIAPQRTARPIVERVAAESAKALQSPDMVKRLAAEGSEPVGSSPREFTDHIRSEREQWRKVIAAAGIRGD